LIKGFEPDISFFPKVTLLKPMHLQPVFQVEALSAKSKAGSGKR
jgi:hypothetical protein